MPHNDPRLSVLASHGHGLAFAAMVDDDAAAFTETVRARPSPRLWHRLGSSARRGAVRGESSVATDFSRGDV
jgi:hypothetical protein